MMLQHGTQMDRLMINRKEALVLIGELAKLAVACEERAGDFAIANIGLVAIEPNRKQRPFALALEVTRG